MKGYKGFDKDMKCRGMQFEVGKTYEHEGDVELCKRGFHFCENPLDIFNYYPPADSKFAEIEAEGVSPETELDSKRVSKKLTVKGFISTQAMVKLSVDFIFSKVDWKNNKESNTGDYSAATNTGIRSAATNTGTQSVATNTGTQSAATNTGYQSVATNTGTQSAATNTGIRSAATNTGIRSAATNTGIRSAATNTGIRSAATNTGDYSAAANTGDYSAATSTGIGSAATNTGIRSAATNTGIRSAASVEGVESVAISIGIEGKAKASLGSFIVLAEWKDGHRISVKSALVDGKKIKADTFYTLKRGKWARAD